MKITAIFTANDSLKANREIITLLLLTVWRMWAYFLHRIDPSRGFGRDPQQRRPAARETAPRRPSPPPPRSQGHGGAVHHLVPAIRRHPPGEVLLREAITSYSVSAHVFSCISTITAPNVAPL